MRTISGFAKSLRAGSAGQATVEYVGIAVAVGVLLVSLGTGLGSHGDKIGSAVAKKLTAAIQGS